MGRRRDDGFTKIGQLLELGVERMAALARSESWSEREMKRLSARRLGVGHGCGGP